MLNSSMNWMSPALILMLLRSCAQQPIWLCTLLRLLHRQLAGQWPAWLDLKKIKDPDSHLTRVHCLPSTPWFLRLPSSLLSPVSSLAFAKIKMWAQLHPQVAKHSCSLSSSPSNPRQWKHCSCWAHPSHSVRVQANYHCNCGPTYSGDMPLKRFLPPSSKLEKGMWSWVLRTVEWGYLLQFIRRPPFFRGIIQT